MNGSDDFFMKMCKEAAEDLANGDTGWRDAHPNTLLLAAFGMLSNYLTSSLKRPLWFFASSVCAGVLGYLVHLIASSGGG